MRIFGSWTLAVCWVIPNLCAAQIPSRTFLNGLTHWRVDHQKEDGTGDDVWIMPASWIRQSGSFAIRENFQRNYITQRVQDSNVSFDYGLFKSVTTIFDGDPAGRSWSGDASGTGSVFDMRIPEGDRYRRYIGQLFAAKNVSVIVGNKYWFAALDGTSGAFALFQSCLSSVYANDGRW
jgi:hypothetical protein